MKTGRIKYFNAKSKFGFVTEMESGLEYYVHEKYLLDKVVAGDEVVFEIKELKRGPAAVNVRKKQ